MTAKRLIEEWLPIKEIGVESRRERAASSALPPLYFLHVWWARRPLTASRAAVLASLLPAWEGSEALLAEHFASEDDYRQWFLRMLGIPAGEPGIDPVATAAAIVRARETGEDLGPNPYGYIRAFGRPIGRDEAATLRSLLSASGFGVAPTVMDPMSGGGSIPFESIRVGLPTVANELNPVASVVLEATLRYPAEYGTDLIADIHEWADRWGDLIQERLDGLYPLPDGENAIGYIWARTVPCPGTGKPVPLSPNWWLRRKTADSVAVRLLPCEPEWDECRFEIVRGTQEELEARCAPSQGTIRRGNAVSPWTGDPVPGDYIRRAAQAERMGAQLFALCIDRGRGRDFRLPTAEDIAALDRAKTRLSENWELWAADGLIPTEAFPTNTNDQRPNTYGMDRWHKLFAPRQLLAMVTYLEALRELAPQMERELGRERAAAVRTYLAVVLDKCANYNCIMSRWHPPRELIAPVFDRHDFSMKWSFAEMNMALKDSGSFLWALSQVVDAYKGLCDLVEPSRPLFAGLSETEGSGPVRVSRENAASLSHLPDGSVDAVVVDPPYGNNVMYAELSDFFYVWLKRSAGDLYPDWFASELVDKDAEAVASPARFEGARGGPAKDLATRDYLLKMRRVFREMRRVVKPNGCMTVMFTHRETDMWNALGLALLDTGWEIGSSWPVHTESEHSLHIAKKNAARSTVLLFCRPRELAQARSFWDRGLQEEVRRTAMYVYDMEGERRCRSFLQSAGLLEDTDFQNLVRAAINAIPRGRKYARGQITGFNVPEAETLEDMRLSLFPEIEVREKLDADRGAEQAHMEIG